MTLLNMNTKTFHCKFQPVSYSKSQVQSQFLKYACTLPPDLSWGKTTAVKIILLLIQALYISSTYTFSSTPKLSFPFKAVKQSF